MAIMSISYNLYKGPSRSYAALIAAIQRFKVYLHPLESTWFVETNLSPQQVDAYLKPFLHVRDKLVITPAAINQGWWTQGLTSQELSWLGAGLSPSTAAVAG